jgi:hypothetical protein
MQSEKSVHYKGRSNERVAVCAKSAVYVNGPSVCERLPQVRPGLPNGIFSFFKRGCPGVGSEPGSSQFHLFSHFHHFTAEPQRLPNGIFSYQKFQFGSVLEGLGMENVGIFYGNLECFTSKKYR